MANRAAFLKTRFGPTSIAMCPTNMQGSVMSAWAHYAANLFVEMRNEFASTDTLSRRSRGSPDTLSPRQSGNYVVGHLAAAHLRRILPQRSRCGSGDRHPYAGDQPQHDSVLRCHRRARQRLHPTRAMASDRSFPDQSQTEVDCGQLRNCAAWPQVASNLLSLRCNCSLMTGVGCGAFLRVERLHVT
jgi:hypothetical protein